MQKRAFSVLATFALATFISVGSADAATESYTVKPGDTLWKIATKHKLTVDELKSLNSLASDSIKTDQKLTVSAKDTVNKKPVASNPGSGKVDAVKKETSSTNSWKDTVATTVKPKDPTISSKKILANAVEVSLPLLGTPYVWAGATTDGFDCSGFIYYVFSEAGLDMPRLDTIGMHTNSINVDEPMPGDLVFFENTYRSGISHAGIYLGEGNFIHAATEKVEISSIHSVYWKDKFTSFKRFNQLN